MGDDGRTAREEVLVWERPRRFEYRVDRIEGPLGRFVDHALGLWVFSDAATRGSRFSWTYWFVPARPWMSPAVALVARTAWARYMRQCADLCAERAKRLHDT